MEESLAVAQPSWRFGSGAQVLDLCSVPGMRPLGRLSKWTAARRTPSAIFPLAKLPAESADHFPSYLALKSCRNKS